MVRTSSMKARFQRTGRQGTSVDEAMRTAFGEPGSCVAASLRRASWQTAFRAYSQRARLSASAMTPTEALNPGVPMMWIRRRCWREAGGAELRATPGEGSSSDCNLEGSARCGPPHSLLLTMRKGFLVVCELRNVMHTQSSVSEKSDWPKIRGTAMLSIAEL